VLTANVFPVVVKIWWVLKKNVGRIYAVACRMYCPLLHAVVAIMHLSKLINQIVLHQKVSTEGLPSLLVRGKIASKLIQIGEVPLVHLSVRQTQPVML